MLNLIFYVYAANYFRISSTIPVSCFREIFSAVCFHNCPTFAYILLLISFTIKGIIFWNIPNLCINPISLCILNCSRNLTRSFSFSINSHSLFNNFSTKMCSISIIIFSFSFYGSRKSITLKKLPGLNIVSDSLLAVFFTLAKPATLVSVVFCDTLMTKRWEPNLEAVLRSSEVE